MNFFLTKFNFLQFQKWPKINFWTGKIFKTAINAISRKNVFDLFDFTSFFFLLGLFFWPSLIVFTKNFVKLIWFDEIFLKIFSGHRSSGGGYDHHNSVYGTYRRGRGHHGGGGLNTSSSLNEYNNFASSFEDEFDLKHFQQSLKSDLDSSPAAYQPPSQSQPHGLQHHASSR